MSTLPPVAPGTFIVLEGPDGSGTTLHSKLLAEHLASQGRDVLLTAEPSSGIIGASIRPLLQGKSIPADALQLLFCADRAEHLEHIVLPALQEGKVVICDRYIPSTIAYGMALGLEKEWLKSLNKNFIQQHLLFFLLPPLSVSRSRVHERRSHDTLEEDALQERVHAAYCDLQKDHPESCFVDTSAEIPDVSAIITGIADECL